MPIESLLATAQQHVVNEADVTPELDQQIRQTLMRCFANDVPTFSVTRAWQQNVPDYNIVLQTPAPEGRVLAHVAVVDRTIRVAGQPLRIAGVANVCVDPEVRGRRVIDGLLATSMTEARRRGYPLGMLFCGKKVIPIYQRNGWQMLRDHTMFRIHDGKEMRVEADQTVLWFPLSADTFPGGEIHLNGDDW